MRNYLFSNKPIAIDIGLLLLRMCFGLLMMQYGWQKFSNYAEWSKDFPDPLGVGSSISLALCILAELFCAALVAMGLFTRIALIPLFINLIVIIFIIHWPEAFSKKEHGITFLIPYLVIFLTGPGKFSVDAWLSKKID